MSMPTTQKLKLQKEQQMVLSKVKVLEGALAVLLCGAGAGRWPAQCDASLRDEDAADAPLRGAAFLVAFFLVPLCALLQWCVDFALASGARTWSLEQVYLRDAVELLERLRLGGALERLTEAIWPKLEVLKAGPATASELAYTLLTLEEVVYGLQVGDDVPECKPWRTAGHEYVGRMARRTRSLGRRHRDDRRAAHPAWPSLHAAGAQQPH